MNIKHIRKDKRISLSMLKRRSGISIAHINDIENNYKIPSLIVAIKIAKALDVSLMDLYKIED